MDIANRRQSLSMDRWLCVYIPRSRTFEASKRTFLAMLKAENCLGFDPKSEYPVYCAPESDDAVYYFFSPPAAQRFKSLVKFWEGFPLSEPKGLERYKRIL